MSHVLEFRVQTRKDGPVRSRGSGSGWGSEQVLGSQSVSGLQYRQNPNAGRPQDRSRLAASALGFYFSIFREKRRAGEREGGKH